MASAPFPDPAVLEECLLADRHRLRRRLQGLKELAHRGEDVAAALGELTLAIDRSRAVAALRRERLPVPDFPAELPITARIAEIRAVVDAHPVVVLCGETGSGKSTQLPKICLSLGRGVFGRIGHTQPRRIAARSLAGRVSAELGRELGTTVGYKVRFRDQVAPESSIKLMTDGILLAEIQRDRYLNEYDTLIIDEAHERSLNVDFLLGYLEQLLPKRPDLRVIVTSATIDPERFAQHFGGAPIVEVSGRSYPVEVRYRPPAEPGATAPTGTAEPAAARPASASAKFPRRDTRCDCPFPPPRSAWKTPHSRASAKSPPVRGRVMFDGYSTVGLASG